MNLTSFAKKTFLALKNPYHTVVKVRPLIIDDAQSLLQHGKEVHYVGVKNTNVIPYSILKKLAPHGFLWHTTDAYALGGRAVDMNLFNPITSKAMSGSSSGTALNVLYGINDLGIGSDGGGSVLAPAACVNLYGFISPLFCPSTKQKTSTDGIAFVPSIGFITRDFALLHQAVQTVLELEEDKSIPTLIVPKNKIKNPYVDIHSDIHHQIGKLQDVVIEEIEYPDLYAPRDIVLSFLTSSACNGKIVVSIEGPVDLYGLGDSVFGQFDAHTQAIQSQSYKGLLRVVTMAKKSAIVLPRQALGVGLMLICDSTPYQIQHMLHIASQLTMPRAALMERYLMNLDLHFTNEFREESE